MRRYSCRQCRWCVTVSCDKYVRFPGEGHSAGSSVKNHAADQRGFTIIEVVVAVIILALAYGTIMQNFSLSLRNIDRADKKQVSVFDQQLQFENQLQQMAFSNEGDGEGEVFLEGSRYRLMLVRNETGELVSLVAESKQ
ncbi:MAG: prepilin-type N-terminal cleavage/methylation domain-containing protein [Deltaproteobacteria bacterium]